MKKNTKIITLVFLSVILISAMIVSAINISASNIDEDDLIKAEIIEMDAEYQTQATAQEANDLTALSIMREHGKTNATELIDDKKADCDLMRVMCSMIQNGDFTDDETIILMRYLYYRVSLLNVPSDTPVLEGEVELEEMILAVLHDESLPDYKKNWDVL